MRLYTDPKIHNKGKIWYIYFRFLHEGEWKLVIVKKGVNRISRLAEKKGYMDKMYKVLVHELKLGYNPITKLGGEKWDILEVLSQELELWKPNKSKSSVGKLTAHFKEFSEYIIKNNFQYYPISDFDTPMAKEFLDYVASKGNSGKTVNDKKSMLSILFNSLVGKEKIPKNPFQAVKKFKQQTGTVNSAFSNEERDKILDYLKENRLWLYNFVQFMYYTYIRPQELFGLQPKHINLVSRTISVPSTISKNRKSESVVIPANLLPIIKSMDLTGEYLFPKENGEQVVKRNKAYNLHKRVLERLGVKGKTLYSWKHTGVCAAYHATNGDIYAIMRQCRHYSVSQTQVYLKSLGLIRNDAMSGEW